MAKRRKPKQPCDPNGEPYCESELLLAAVALESEPPNIEWLKAGHIDNLIQRAFKIMCDRHKWHSLGYNHHICQIIVAGMIGARSRQIEEFLDEAHDR